MGKKYQEECENYILSSVNHEMYLQRIKKSTLSIFDHKRCYESKNKSLPWIKKNKVLYMYPYICTNKYNFSHNLRKFYQWIAFSRPFQRYIICHNYQKIFHWYTMFQVLDGNNFS